VSAAVLIAEALIGHDVRRIDAAVAVEAHSFTAGERAVHLAAQTVTFFGSTVWLTLMVVGLVVYWLRRGRRNAAVLLLVVSIGSAVVCRTIKIVVDRDRPDFVPALADPHGSSFPSGHTMQSVAIYGVLLAISLPWMSRRIRRLVVPLGVSFIAGIAISRVLLGVHYVSDISVGALLGMVWLLLVALSEPAIVDLAREQRVAIDRTGYIRRHGSRRCTQAAG
jgi:undecaprenyl-diphosphatase